MRAWHILVAWLGAEIVQQLIAAGEQLLIQELLAFIAGLFNQRGYGFA